MMNDRVVRRIAIARETLQRKLWPGEHYRVDIVGAEYDDANGLLLLTVRGEDSVMPDTEWVQVIVVDDPQTVFHDSKSPYESAYNKQKGVK